MTSVNLGVTMRDCKISLTTWVRICDDRRIALDSVPCRGSLSRYCRSYLRHRWVRSVRQRLHRRARRSPRLQRRSVQRLSRSLRTTRMEVAASQGTGFVVRADGVVVTNWHVMAGAVSATVTLKTGENYNRVSFLDGDKDGDIAILKIPGFGLSVADVVAEIPTVGSKIVTVSSPLGLDQTVTEGIVSAIRILDGRQLVQITAPISHGSSGGPVIDSAGKVFAISTLTLEEGQGLNFAVPVKYAMGLLSSSVTPRELSERFRERF